MAKKKKPDFLEAKNLPRKSRDLYGGDYVDGVKTESGKELIRPLNKKEKDWLNQFNSEYCQNNHSEDGSLHSELPDYEEKVKKEMYDQTNARNRDLFTTISATTEFLEMKDYVVCDKMHKEEYTDLEYLLKIYGLEQALEFIIQKTLDSDPIDSKALYRFAKDAFRLFTLERKTRNKEKKK